MTTVISPCGSADLAKASEVFALYRQFYRQPHDVQQASAFLAQRLQRCDSHILLAREAERVLGFVQIYPVYSSIRLDTAWLLNDLYVREEARGKGIARQLLTVVAEQGRALGIRTIRLSTQRDNWQAQQLYLATGYQPDAQFLHFSLDLNAPAKE